MRLLYTPFIPKYQQFLFVKLQMRDAYIVGQNEYILGMIDEGIVSSSN